MGVWGSGNLDSDGALDFVDERSAEFVGRVWTALQTATSWEAGDSDHDALFVDLECMFALDAAGCFSVSSVPPLTALEPVLVAWLEGWSGYFDRLSGPEFKAERRVVIEATFDRLRALAARADGQRTE